MGIITALSLDAAAGRRPVSPLLLHKLPRLPGHYHAGLIGHDTVFPQGEGLHDNNGGSHCPPSRKLRWLSVGRQMNAIGTAWHRATSYIAEIHISGNAIIISRIVIVV